MKIRRYDHSVDDWGIIRMLRTISLGSCVLVQGHFVRQMSDGRIMVRVDDKTFVGHPISPVGQQVAQAS